MADTNSYKTVGEIMKDSPTVTVDTPFKTVVRTMDQANISAVPVLDAGTVVGMVTESDVLLKEALGPQPEAGFFERWWRREELNKADATTAGEMMSSVTSIPADLIAWQAAQTMYDEDAVRLPVVDAGGVYQGVVSWRDLIRSFLRDDEEIHDEVKRLLTASSMVSSPGDIRVTVTDGIVTVAGQVETPDIIEVLLDQVRNMSGVVEIKDSLTSKVDPDEAARIATDLTRGRPDR